MNNSKVKTPMSLLEDEKRQNTFLEVALGYSEEEALTEADRCLNCKVPNCVKGCPVNNNIPGFIAKVKAKDYDGAFEILSETTCLPSVCGRVCPQELQCEGSCIRNKMGEPVSIGRLERFVGDYHRLNNNTTIEVPKKNDKHIAIVGSGPAGIACAYDLLKAGFNVTIYDRYDVFGGVLSYGIPSFVLPKDVVKEQVDNIVKLGCKFEVATLGKDVTVSELSSKYDAVFLAIGATIGKTMGIPGEDLKGMYDANDFLKRINIDHENESSSSYLSTVKDVIIVGGGNVAIDAARVSKRLGANTTIVYRRSEKEMPARKEEIVRCKEEGIQLCFLTNPVAIKGNGKVEAVECIKMELSEPDASGRARPIEVPNSNYDIKADVICMAVSSAIDKSVLEDINLTKWNTIIVDENMMSSKENIYAGGDLVNGPATVILAMSDGRKAAKAIISKYN